MEKFIYTPQGVCSKLIEIESNGDIVNKVVFTGGCSGNTQGVAKLCEGMSVDAIINRLAGIKCGSKKTSCPDQLAMALKAMKEERKAV